VTVQGAAKRGWIGAVKVDRNKLKQWVVATVAAAEQQALSIDQVSQQITQKYGTVPENNIVEAVKDLTLDEKLMLYKGKPEQQNKPQSLIHGMEAMIHDLQPTEVAITPAETAKRGWLYHGPGGGGPPWKPVPKGFTLTGTAGAEKIMPILGQIGNLYLKGATSKISSLDISDLELADDGRLRLTLENASPQTMKNLAEFFEILQMVAKPGKTTQADIDIEDPTEDCLLIKELKK